MLFDIWVLGEEVDGGDSKVSERGHLVGGKQASRVEDLL